VAHHEAILWLALVAAGNMKAADLPDLARHRERLTSVTSGSPRIVEVRSHHRVSRGDGFRMTEGFRNFDGVSAGQVVARDRKGPISVTENCRLLLPLYQDQGSDGFFTVREVSAFWLALSRLLRRLALPRLMRWVPGVRIHPHREETLVVHTRLARFYPLQIFHLMGFRKKRWQGNLLLVSRRRYDLTPDRRSAEPVAERTSP
jgi:succinylglutamate desuccinylase